MRTKFYWWERLQVEFVLRFKLLPNKELGWKKWAWDPAFGMTLPGQVLDTRYRLPNSTSWDVDTTMIEDASAGGPAKFKSRVFWIHGALRVVGIDVGAGFYFRPSPIIKLNK